MSQELESIVHVVERLTEFLDSFITVSVALSELKYLQFAVAIGSIATVSSYVFRRWRNIFKIQKKSIIVPVNSLSQEDHYIFVYGSLLVGDSILRTIETNTEMLNCIPARLKGYRVGWGALSKRPDFLDSHGTTYNSNALWASLALRKGDPSDAAPGAVIGLSHRNYLALISRERNYTPTSVQDSISPLNPTATFPPGREIVTFIPKDQQPNARANQYELVYIREAYRQDVADSLKRLGFKNSDMNHLKQKPENSEVKPAKIVENLIEESYCRTSTKTHQKLIRSTRSALVNAVAADRSSLSLPIQDERDYKFALRPIIIPRHTFDKITQVSQDITSASTKALNILAENPEILEYFGYSIQEIDILKHGKERGDLTPQIARVDMSVGSNKINVFELNSDSPGGMRHLDIVARIHGNIVTEHPSLRWIRPVAPNLMGKCVDSILQKYRKSNNGTVVIAEKNPEKWATYPEMLRFAQLLNERGVDARIVDIATDPVSNTNGTTCLDKASRRKISTIYKRVVIEDLRKTKPDISDIFFDAYLSDSCLFVNSLAARLAGSKLVLAMLKAEEFSYWLGEVGLTLTESEKNSIDQCIPETYIWGNIPKLGKITWNQRTDLMTYVATAPFRWVMKPFDGFGGQNIQFGADDNSRNMEREFELLWDTRYIVQEYVPHGRVLMPYVEQGSVFTRYESYIVGAYVVDEHFVAAEAKCSETLPINMAKGGVRAPVFTTV